MVTVGERYGRFPSEMLDVTVEDLMMVIQYNNAINEVQNMENPGSA